MRNKTPKAGMLAGVLAVFATGALAYPHYRAAMAAMRLYYLREMLAALLLFSMGFTILAVVISILFLIDRDLNRALAWTDATRRMRRWDSTGVGCRLSTSAENSSTVPSSLQNAKL